MEREDKRVRFIAKSIRRQKLIMIQKKRQAALEEEQKERLMMSKEERLVRLYHQGIARALAAAQRALVSAKLEQQGVTDSHNHKTSGKDEQVRISISCDDNKQKKQAREHAVHGYAVSLPRIETLERQAMRRRGRRKKKSNRLLKFPSISNWSQVGAKPADTSEIQLVEQEFDYGDEFDEIVDETELARLIC